MTARAEHAPAIQPARLRIEPDGDGYAFTWAEPGGEGVYARRTVHPDDLAAARGLPADPPRSTADLERAGTRIYSRLMERTVREAAFRTEGGLIALEGDLTIPWEIAFDGTRFLCEARAAGWGTGPEPEPPGALRILLVTDPTNDLPHCAAEAAQVRAHLQGAARVEVEALCGAAATRDAILTALESRGFDIIHFACHADHDAEDPGRSALRAFDGPLTVETIRQAAAAKGPRLCVVNACESGRPGGLAEAFRAAGAAAAVGALWPVHNKSAAHLMAGLYGALARGAPVGEALREARAATRRAFAFDESLAWAAFRLLGPPELRLAAAGGARTGRVALIGRAAEWAALDDAWAEARAGRAVCAALVGGAGSGKSRLLGDWLAAHAVAPAGDIEAPPPARPAILTRDDFLPGDAARVREILADGPAAVVLTVRDAGALAALRPLVRAVPLPPLEGEALESLFRGLGAEPPGGLACAQPGEAERIALGMAAAETAGALANALPEAERSMLRAGGILGEGFSALDAGALLGWGEAATWRALEGLCAADWLIESDPGRFRFRDAAARGAVLEAFRPRGERLAWERRAAEIFLGQGRIGDAGEHWRAAGEDAAARDAYERAFREGGSPEAALRWRRALAEIGVEAPDARKAAEACAAAGDWEGARGEFERALRAEPEDPALLLAAADACLRVGDAAASERHLAAAEGLAPRAALDVAWGELLLHRCRAADALARAAAAMAATEEPGLRARAALCAANAALLAAMPQDAARACEAGLAAGGGHEAALRRALARARQYAGDTEAAEAALRELVRGEGGGAAPHELAAALLAMAELARDQGRLAEALGLLDEAQAMAEECGLPAIDAEGRNLRSSVYRRQGRYPEALEAAAAAGEAARGAGAAQAAIHAEIHTATALAEQGELEAAVAAAEEAAGLAEAAGYAFGRAWARSVLGVARLEAGDSAAAREAFGEALAISRAIDGHIGIAFALNQIGWTDWEEGTASPGTFREAERAAERIAYRAVQYPAAFGAALCEGDTAAMEAALSALEGLNMGALVAWLRLRRGEWLARQGRAEEAERDLAAAWRVSRRLGLQAVHARADRALGM